MFAFDNAYIFIYNVRIMTRCFMMLKPGVLNRRHVGEVISRFEKKGLKLLGLKMMRIDMELAKKHYDVHADKPFFADLVDFITSAPVVAMVWAGDDCIKIARKIIGATSPVDAAPGTIRGDFCMHTNKNIVHASDSDENAEREIKLFFDDEELFDWDDPLTQWI